MENTKRCPYCGEEIKADATKCKHCGEWLDDTTDPEQKTNQYNGGMKSKDLPKNEVEAGSKPVVAVSATESVSENTNESLFKSCFWDQMAKHYCDFKGNVDRKTFWICYLYYSLLMLVVAGISACLPLVGTIIMLVLSLGLTLPFLGLMVRRLHDIGKKGGWIFISLIPFVGAIWLLVFLAKKGEVHNPNKWKGKDTILTIAMLVVGCGLYFLSDFMNPSLNIMSEIGRKDNCYEIGNNISEDEIKAEIERLVLEAYKTYTNLDNMDEIILEESPDFQAAIEAASEFEDASGFLCVDWDFYTVSQDPTCRRVSDVRAEIVDENSANVYVTLEDLCANERNPDPIIVILSMIRKNGEGKWLVDDVDNTKELMLECASSDLDDVPLDDGRDDYKEESENESALDLEHVSYEGYYNPRFDFSVSYPSFFKRKYEAANQDGCEFLFGNNYSMKAYGMNYVSERTVRELFEDSKSSKDTYSTCKDNWFVVSGVNEQGNIYYRKTIIESDVEYVVELVYPQTKKAEYDAVVKKVIGSFQVMGSEEEDGERYVVIDGSELRLRLGPSTSSETLKWGDGSNRHPEVGEKYRYLDESSDFYKIDYKGNEVWVSKQFTHIEMQ